MSYTVSVPPRCIVTHSVPGDTPRVCNSCDISQRFSVLGDTLIAMHTHSRRGGQVCLHLPNFPRGSPKTTHLLHNRFYSHPALTYLHTPKRAGLPIKSCYVNSTKGHTIHIPKNLGWWANLWRQCVVFCEKISGVETSIPPHQRFFHCPPLYHFPGSSAIEFSSRKG